MGKEALRKIPGKKIRAGGGRVLQIFGNGEESIGKGTMEMNSRVYSGTPPASSQNDQGEKKKTGEVRQPLIRTKKEN